MLNSMREFLHLMRSQRRQLYLSLLLSFLDGILLMLPWIVAYRMMAAMPEYGRWKKVSQQQQELL